MLCITVRSNFELLPHQNRDFELVHTCDPIIVHGDVKGTNILVSKARTCMLCDFGMSKSTGTETTAHLSGASTLRFRAPELMDGKSRTFASDVWAFAMMIYQVRPNIGAGYCHL